MRTLGNSLHDPHENKGSSYPFRVLNLNGSISSLCLKLRWHLRMEFLHCWVINVFTILCWGNSQVLEFMVTAVHATAKPISHLLFFLLNLPKGYEIFLCVDSKKWGSWNMWAETLCVDLLFGIFKHYKTVFTAHSSFIKVY